MPAPYTIEETADATGLSVKFIRRLKAALPALFEKHTERGQSNALLFDEEIIEVLKRTRELKNKGRTLQQIRDELAEVAKREKEKKDQVEGEGAQTSNQHSAHSIQNADSKSLERENQLLRSQVDLLSTLLKKAEERFDRLLPAATEGPKKKEGLKGQLMLWLVEAVVVTAFAAGFIFMIWLFAQRAFQL